MIRLLLIFLFLLLSLYLGHQLQHDPGYVFISINHWTIESTLWITCIGIILFFILFYVLLRLLNSIIHFPKSWNISMQKRRVQKAQEETRQGLIEFSEGYWQQAKVHLLHALPNSDTPLLNYLTAARAAQEMGNSTLRDDYLRQAQEAVPQAKVAVELTQAQLQLANHQWEQALATLRHLQDLTPHHPYVLKLLMHLYQEVKDWRQLILLLPQIKRKKLLSQAAFLHMEKQAYVQHLIELTKYDKAQTVEHFFKHLPKFIKNYPEVLATYCNYLIEQQHHDKAEQLLRHTLAKQYDDALIHIYAKLPVETSHLTFSESLLKEHSESALLYLCLSRMCTALQLWGKAKTYCEKSIEIQASAAAYIELGQLFEQQEEYRTACQSYYHGLNIACGVRHGL